MAAEAGAVLGLFKRMGEQQPEAQARAPDGIAEVVLHAFLLADRLGIDLDEAVTRKLAEAGTKHSGMEPGATVSPDASESRLAAKTQGLREELRLATSRLAAQKVAVRGAPARVHESDALTRAAPPPSPRAPEPRPAPAPAVHAPAPPVRASASPTVTRTASPDAPTPPARSAGAQSPTERPPGPVVAAVPPPPPPPPPPSPAPAAAPLSEPPPERFSNLDTESVIGFLKSLSRRVDGARSDDPLLRELHDEIQTLRRNLYSSNAKPTWIGASLDTIRTLLEEAKRHSIADEIRAAEHLVHVQRILNR
ncbi:MAG: hypothetical protein IT515_12980 [Burkholderiales bacterium]|nr:hypothetical protein [Burkholderiales bacterium]